MDPFRTPPRFAAAALVVLPALLAGCGAKEDEPELARFNSCAELNTWMKVSAKKQIDWNGGGGGGIPQPASRGMEDVAMESSAGAAPAPAASGTGSPDPSQLGQGGSVQGDAGNRAWSTTNVQEEGVDEADFVKNDGDHIYLLDGDALSILDAWPADELAEVSRTEIEGTPQSLYFDGIDTVVVFSVLGEADARPASGAEPMVSSAEGDGRWSYDPISKVTVLDVADRAAPEAMRELYFDGSVVSSRRIGEKLHIVTRNDLGDLIYGDNDGGFGANARRHARVDRSQAENWLPAIQDNIKSGGTWSTQGGVAVACEAVYKPNVRTELQFTGVHTLDLSAPDGALGSVGALTRADISYASENALYLAMSEWESGPFRSLDGRVQSRVHKFDLRGDSPSYTASGVVPGSMLSSYSLGEHDGHLRIATTTWTDMGGSSNAVYVLGQEDTLLTPTGSLEGLAQGESIYAVRFVGDRGYVVTFERIDPLFTLDLSDPADPRVVGELEVTGFSNYLHPIDEGHLLAIGEEISSDGWTWMGLQVSLFDVTDFAEPELLDREIVGQGGSSEAQYDPHAFTWFGELETLALPVMGWDPNGMVSQTSLELFHVTPEAGIESVGSVDHAAFVGEEAAGWGWCDQVRRSIFIDDYVFAVSNLGVQVVRLDDPSLTLASYTAEQPNCFGWGGAVLW